MLHLMSHRFLVVSYRVLESLLCSRVLLDVIFFLGVLVISLSLSVLVYLLVQD
jgi:hypothetical protein